MKSKKYFVFAFIPMLALSLLGVSVASAHGWFSYASPDEISARYTSMFQKQADLLGVNVSEVKDAWAQGKSFQTLATEKGITAAELRARMKDARKKQLAAELQILVDKGNITQAQADARMNFTSQKIDSGKGMMMGRRGMGMGFFY